LEAAHAHHVALVRAITEDIALRMLLSHDRKPEKAL